MKKMTDREHQDGPRKDDYLLWGYSLKYAYHLIRLLGECEQILTTGDLNLELDNEKLKSIRRGEWSIDQIKEYFNTKEKMFEELYQSSTIPHSPNANAIKQLLLQCIECHYGSLDKMIQLDDRTQNIISEIDLILQKYR